jgi:P27 family predicted phage terminase small subunit
MPARKPTRLKILNGSAAHDPQRINRREPQPTVGFPRMPSDLGPVAQQVWRQVARTMGRTGVITGADSDILRVFCETVARYRQAETVLAQSGPLIVAKGNGSRRGELVKNPLAQIVRDNAVLMRMLARELGLTPASRPTLDGHPAPERDEFAAFLDGDDA